MDVDRTKSMDRLLGDLLFPLLAPFRRKQLDRHPKNILLIQLWGIGETILVLPAMKALRSIFPQTRISVLCTPRNKEVFFQTPFANEVMVIEPSLKSVLSFITKKHNAYDLTIDLEEYLNVSTFLAYMTGKTSLGFATRKRKRMYTQSVDYNDDQHNVETVLDLIRVFRKIPPAKHLESLHASPTDVAEIDRLIRGHRLSGKKVIVIAPSVAESSKARVWPRQNFIELTRRLVALKGYRVVFVGGPNDVEAVGKITKKFKGKVLDFSGLMTLRGLFLFVERCQLLIGNDSGPMHIGAAQGVKTIGLFGPNSPVRFAPFGPGNVSFYKPKTCPYSPCINVHKGNIPDCLFAARSPEYQQCMKAISVDEVYVAAKKMLS